MFVLQKLLTEHQGRINILAVILYQLTSKLKAKRHRLYSISTHLLLRTVMLLPPEGTMFSNSDTFCVPEGYWLYTQALDSNQSPHSVLAVTHRACALLLTLDNVMQRLKLTLSHDGVCTYLPRCRGCSTRCLNLIFGKFSHTFTHDSTKIRKKNQKCLISYVKKKVWVSTLNPSWS